MISIAIQKTLTTDIYDKVPVIDSKEVIESKLFELQHGIYGKEGKSKALLKVQTRQSGSRDYLFP